MKRSYTAQERSIVHYAMIAPFFVLFAVFYLAPILYGLAMSFTNWDGVHVQSFVGFSNYVRILRSQFFLKSLANLGTYVLMTIPIGILLSLCLALLVDRFRGFWANLFRNAYFLPTVIPLFLAATVWRWMLTPDFGIVNLFLGIFGVRSIDWLGDPAYMLPAVVIVDLWRAMGYNMVILLAGLRTIPATYYEAAEMDGASALQRIRYITIPQLEPVLFLVLVGAFISDLQVFDVPWLMSKSAFRSYGGPLQGMLFPVMDIVGRAFGAQRFAQAAAYSFMLLALILSVTAAQFAVRRRWSNR